MESIIAAVSKIALTWRRYNQRMLLPEKFTLKQFSVLEWLLTKEYGHPAQLAEYIYADRPTATVVINNLQKAGCIEKTPDPDNKKYTRVAITEKGRQKAAQIRELINSRRRVTVTECLTDSEKTRLRALLGKIQAHLDKNTG